MRNITVVSFNQLNLSDLLVSGEQLLWSGQPGYGQRLSQVVGSEKMIHLCFLLGTLIMWSTIPFIEPEVQFGRQLAIWVYGFATISFAAVSFFVARQRQYTVNCLAYFVTDRRAIVCRQGRNWRLGTRIYVVSCPHSKAYPYSVVSSHPYQSLQVGTLLSEDQVQPFGFGLSHPGHPLLWGRISAPVLFDYIANAQAVLQIIRCQADKKSECSELASGGGNSS